MKVKENPSLGEMIAFAVGDVGCNFVWSTVASFLMLYYTDSVGIAAATVGTLLLLSRLLDGASDLVMGTIVDHTHTRWGKARPWILWMAVPMGLGLVLIFSVPSSLSYGAKVAYASITYIVMAVGIYTACNLSYSALLCLAAPRPQDRVMMTSLRFVGAYGVVMVINSLCISLVDKFGWTGMSAIFGAIAIVLLFITFFGTHERVSTDTASAKTDKPKMSVGKSFILLCKNRYFLLLVAVFVADYVVWGVLCGAMIYYARDVLGDAGTMGVLTMFNILPRLVITLLYPYITKLVGKWRNLIIAYVIEFVGFLIMAFGHANLTVAIVGLLFVAIGGAPHFAGIFAMIPDLVDYGEWKTGVRLDGLTSSVASFGSKVGTGVGSAIVGWGLAWAAYDGKLASQSAETVQGIKVIFTVIPIIFLVIGFISLWFCNIDKIYPEIKAGLEKVRGKKEE